MAVIPLTWKATTAPPHLQGLQTLLHVPGTTVNSDERVEREAVHGERLGAIPLDHLARQLALLGVLRSGQQ